MNMFPSIVAEPLLVAQRIREKFGWVLADFYEVIDAMVAARNSCTENDVPAARGTRAYLDGTRRLREMGRKHDGWELNEEGGLCGIMNEARGIKLLVCNTDEDTGLPGGLPQNRNRKGAATSTAISGQQLLLSEILREADYGEHSGLKIWYLFVYSDGHDTVRAELACPMGTQSGYFEDFAERIIIQGQEGPGHFATELMLLHEEENPIEIRVTRKGA